jgi:GNAT superfamily N-acetyltransferase
MRTVLVFFSVFKFTKQSPIPPPRHAHFWLSSYELQVSQSVQRGGIGKTLMKCLYDMARGWKMQKVMLTVLKGDDPSLVFRTFCHTQSCTRREPSSILILQGYGVCV